MGIFASDLATASLGSFVVGSVLGAASVYCFLRTKKLPIEVHNEETFEFPDTNDEYRLILAVRNDLKMQKGKVAAQCGHASVGAYIKATQKAPLAVKRWLRNGGTKITVKVDTEDDLLRLQKEAKLLNVVASMVRDAGQTQVAPGSRTVIALGPAPKSVLDKLTGHFKLY